MGIDVLDMVEVYANSVYDTQTLLSKEPVESPSSSRGVKRRMSAGSEDSGCPRSHKSPRSQKSENFSTSSSCSFQRSSRQRYSYTPTAYLGSTTDTDDEEIVKRTKLGSRSSSSSLNSTAKIRESYESRRKRFLGTAEALKHSRILDVTMKTAELLRKNQELQRDIENLQKETSSFVLSVLTNPENRSILDNIRSQAQLYEIVVPGSQGIMSVTSSSSLPEHNFHYGNSVSSSSSEDDDSHDSNGNVSSPSPAPTESEGASSMSEDSDSSENGNIKFSRRASISKH